MAKKLYGTDPDQVPTNADLGTMAYQDSSDVNLVKDSGAALTIERQSDDGDLAIFKKDTTTVGSIGSSASGQYLHIGSDDTGITFAPNVNSIIPFNVGTGAYNANLDLGYSGGTKFRNIYLNSGVYIDTGGGVYLGGTDADHKLDYFEKGATTVSLRGATEPATLLTATMYWRRIDDQVLFQLGFESVDTTGYSGAMTITELPFANTSGSRAIVHAGLYNSGTWTDILVGVIGTSSTTIEFQNLRSGNTWQAVNHSAGTNRYIWVTGSYLN